MWVWSLGQEDPLEKEMATHSSSLAWKNRQRTWTEEPGGLQSNRLRRVGHNWATEYTHVKNEWSCTLKTGASLVAQTVKNLLQCKQPGTIPGSGRSPGERNGHPLFIHSPVFLPGESHGQRSLAGYSPWGHKESDMTEWLSTHTLKISAF